MDRMDLFDDLLRQGDARQSAYAAACLDPAGSSHRAADIVEELAGELSAEWTEERANSLIGDLKQGKKRLASCTLLALALVSVRQGLWQVARDLLAFLPPQDGRWLFVERLAEAAEHERQDLGDPADEWLKDRFCPMPFDQIDTAADQSVHFCPAAWQPVPIGDLSEDPGSIWNGPAAQEIRRSILDGDFSHCSRRHCPHIRDRRLRSRDFYLAADPASPAMERYGRIIAGKEIRLDTKPFRANLSHDRSCNQSCPSCRPGRITLRKYDRDRLDRLVNDNYADFLSSAARVTLARDGEPFASRHYLNFLQAYCARTERTRTLQIQTSGLLLTEALWNRLDLWGHVSSVRVSVDAATPDTYARVRLGGRFDRLLPNLHFLGHLRRLQMIDVFRMDFLVQRDNYAEMPDFVRLARQVGADSVLFLRLRNWGTFTEEEFLNRDIANPEHPDHDRLRTVLEDPVLSSPEVDKTALEVM